jgi:hypothetical protein
MQRLLFPTCLRDICNPRVAACARSQSSRRNFALGGHVRALLVEPRRKTRGGANMKFHEVVGRFDAFTRELEAVRKRDPILDEQIKTIAARYQALHQSYERSHEISAKHMREFMDEAEKCLKQRARELEAPSLKKAN